MNKIKNNKKIKLKMTLIKVYNSFCLPAMLVHELLHFLLIKLSLAEYLRTRVEFDDNYKKNSSFSIKIYYMSDYYIQKFLISMAPFIGLLLWIIPFLMGLPTITVISIIYTLLCIRVVIPSKDDFNAIKIKKEAY